MRKRRCFRFSQKIKNIGVSEAKQHIIHGVCIDPQKTSVQDAAIRSLCREIAGHNEAGLYRFLTDNTIDHNYIEMNYHIRPNALFEMKREFYKKYKDRFL
ncbi:MAG: hypothetical protein ACI4EA_08145 [Candidatus Ornithomonoglobus sp.]